MSGDALPQGTVTILFTDTVDSTPLNEALGDERAHELRMEVEALCGSQIVPHGGVLVKGMGDGLMVAFSSAKQAVECATAIQADMAARNADAGRPVQLRVGLHTGEVMSGDRDLYGLNVTAAKRIESVAPPGGIRSLKP